MMSSRETWAARERAGCARLAATRASRRQPGRAADLAELSGDLAPGLAGVLADVDLAEQGERDDPRRVGRMRGQAPEGGVGAARPGGASRYPAAPTPPSGAWPRIRPTRRGSSRSPC